MDQGKKCNQITQFARNFFSVAFAVIGIAKSSEVRNKKRKRIVVEIIKIWGKEMAVPTGKTGNRARKNAKHDHERNLIIYSNISQSMYPLAEWPRYFVWAVCYFVGSPSRWRRFSVYALASWYFVSKMQLASLSGSPGSADEGWTHGASISKFRRTARTESREMKNKTKRAEKRHGKRRAVIKRAEVIGIHNGRPRENWEGCLSSSLSFDLLLSICADRFFFTRLGRQTCWSETREWLIVIRSEWRDKAGTKSLRYRLSSWCKPKTVTSLCKIVAKELHHYLLAVAWR